MAKYVYTGPEMYRPVSPWGYFGYTLLFSIPLIGFIFMLVFAFDDSNINRRNFARSYFCVLAILLILIAALAVTGVATSFLQTILNR